MSRKEYSELEEILRSKDFDIDLKDTDIDLESILNEESNYAPKPRKLDNQNNNP